MEHLSTFWRFVIIVIGCITAVGTAVSFAFVGILGPSARLPDATRKDKFQYKIWFISGVICTAIFAAMGLLFVMFPPSAPSTPKLTPTSTQTPLWHTSTPSASVVTPSLSPTPSTTLLPDYTPTPQYTPMGFCDEVTEPCLFLPEPGDSWPLIATQSTFGDSCKWPEIADQNRDSDGTYRQIVGILNSGGVFIPIPAKSGYYRPRVRNENGKFEFIPICADQSPYSFPCTYTIQEGDGISGLTYSLLAWKFYRAYENSDGKSLDLWIASANLANGCTFDSVRLFPEVTVVIPQYPPLNTPAPMFVP